MKLIAPNPEVRVAFHHDYRPKPLLTASEAKFHTCLLALSDSRIRIQCKPRLADVFDHGKELSALNKISQKHVDFLICRNDDWLPMLAIELDDDSHERKDRKERDMFVNELFAYTGVPLLRIHVREVEQLETLAAKLSHAWLHRSKYLEA